MSVHRARRYVTPSPWVVYLLAALGGCAGGLIGETVFALIQR